jgi:hypothetical protein
MSLKAFHLVFVTVSVVLSLGFGAWAVTDYRKSGIAESLWWGVGSFAGAMALIVYGRWFLRKLKGVGYL